MLHNEILLRSNLAHPFERNYTNYPGQEGMYGKPNPPPDGGVPAALHGWKAVKEPSKKTKDYGQDFIQLNRAAVSQGLTTAEQHYEFRAHNDMHMKHPPKSLAKFEYPKPKQISPNMVFGMPTRPSTPIHDLLEHKFQDQWIRERYNAMRHVEAKFKDQHMKPGQVNHTRTSMLRYYTEPVEKSAPWHMPRFAKKAEPALETFRAPAERERAYTNYASDCISRKGVKGQGVYQSAKF
jgi:hypothetical protein